MNFFHAVILGIVEGITEFLPISSTGHLILASRLLALPATEFRKSFEIIIQMGAIFAVLVFYWKKFASNFEILKRVVAAFIPTGLLGFMFYKIIKKYLLGSEIVVLWSLFLGGIFLVLFEWRHKPKPGDQADLSKLSYRQAAGIGLFQSLAMIPGVSRSAATLVGALWLGVERKTAVEFSFLLAVPTLLAASGLDLLKNHALFSDSPRMLLLAGGITSFIVAMLTIQWFLRFIKNNDLSAFGIYRIFVAAIFWFFL